MSKQQEDPNLEQYRKASEEAKRLAAQVRESAIAQAKSAIETLKSLGLRYRLVQDNGTQAVKQARKQTGRKAASRKTGSNSQEPYCRICKIKGHDARRHRFTQPGKKRAFTAAELKRMGLSGK